MLKNEFHLNTYYKKAITLYLELHDISGMENEIGLRQVIIYKGEDNYWVAECPSLPGCISQGRTKKDALQNIREAIDVYILALKQDNLKVPEDNLDVLLMAI